MLNSVNRISFIPEKVWLIPYKTLGTDLIYRDNKNCEVVQEISHFKEWPKVAVFSIVTI